MVLTVEIDARSLADLLVQVEAGNEVMLTKGNKPVARLVPVGQRQSADGASDRGLRIASLEGHRVLTPEIGQAELADELFAPS